MINNRVLIFVLILFSINLNGQDDKVWKGDVYAKDFDSFFQGQYKTIEGNLNVYSTKLKDLAQLKSLKLVKGDVNIGIYDYKKNLDEGNNFLTSLKGLESLEEVTGKLVIRKNKLLETLKALKKLKKVSNLNVSNNPFIVNLQGLNNVSVEIPLGLKVYKNKRLEDISQLSKITLVGDYLTITSNLSLQNLEGLHNIKAVKKGYLAIRNNTYLENLKGLRKITTVDEEVQITENPLIKNLNGLEKLISIGKFLYIKENEKLQNLEGLKSLISVEKDFEIRNNNSLVNLDGLDKLTTINGTLWVENNPLLNDVNGLNSLTDTIGESIFFIKNTSLKKITGLNKITDVKKSVVLSRNHLKEVTGFKNIKTIGKSLSFSCNYLEKLEGFDNLTKIKNFGIGSEKTEIDFSGALKKLTHIEGFFLFSNEVLEHFKGPNSVIEINKMQITDNEKLVSFSGFNNLKIVNDKIRFEDNTQLKLIDGFNSLEIIKKRLNIGDNPKLESIKGFKNISHIESLWLDENRKLNDLSGFSNLKTANDIFLRRNYALKDLTGFKSLEKVTEELTIRYGSGLTSLTGLENLKFLGKQLDFTDNRNLVDYSALQDAFLKTITEKHLWFSKNKYSPTINQLLIHDKLGLKVIPEAYLKNKNRKWLALFRNEVFARKGFVFGKEYLINHFTKQGWYIPNDSIKIVLNDIEEENIRLIKKHEKTRVDYVTNTMINFKNQYKNSIEFSSGYERLHPVLKTFIADINIKKLVKSNKLIFSKDYDFDNNVWGKERNNDDELDSITIFFDDNNNYFSVRVNNNYLEEDDYDSWIQNEAIVFGFEMKDNNTITFVKAFNE